MKTIYLFLLASCLWSAAVAQQRGTMMNAAPSESMQDMPGMDGNDRQTKSAGATFIDLSQQHLTSGTGAEPNSTPFEMVMKSEGNWMLMFHGLAFIADTQQSKPRGADKLFSTNWFMPMAQKKFGNGTLTLRAMLSLEPATVSERRYPELFQQGETAFGNPIVDGQHPHDFFMEIAAMYDYRIGARTLLSFYAAPVGDPAIGPVAYPHRASASEDPAAPLGHHLEDSTHIADEVFTAGIVHDNVRLEASGFHGREPDEYRWDVDSGKIDSWSTRITVNPGQNWSVQYSIGQFHSPEAQNPNQDQRRMTASVMYNQPLRRGNLSSMLLWGRNQDLMNGNVGNAYLLESTINSGRNSLWTRIENVDRTNQLLDAGKFTSGFVDRYFARVQAYTAGYDREIGHIPHLSTAVGGQFSWYGVPEILTPTYGAHPVGGLMFLRLSVH